MIWLDEYWIDSRKIKIVEFLLPSVIDFRLVVFDWILYLFRSLSSISLSLCLFSSIRLAITFITYCPRVQIAIETQPGGGYTFVCGQLIIIASSKLNTLNVTRINRMSSIAVKPTTHTACRSSDKTKLVAYQIGKNEKPVVVSIRNLAELSSIFTDSRNHSLMLWRHFKRPYIPADEVDWSVPSPNYQPVNYTSPVVLANPEWADPPLPP